MPLVMRVAVPPAIGSVYRSPSRSKTIVLAVGGDVEREPGARGGGEGVAARRLERERDGLRAGGGRRGAKRRRQRGGQGGRDGGEQRHAQRGRDGTQHGQDAGEGSPKPRAPRGRAILETCHGVPAGASAGGTKRSGQRLPSSGSGCSITPAKRIVPESRSRMKNTNGRSRCTMRRDRNGRDAHADLRDRGGLRALLVHVDEHVLLHVATGTARRARCARSRPPVRGTRAPCPWR